MLLDSVLFLTQGASNRLPSRRLRVLKLLPFFHGITHDIDVAPKNIIDSLRLLPKIFRFKKIFIQKELVPFSFLLLLKFFSKVIIFDFDDAIHLRQLSFGGYRRSRKRQARFEKLCKFSNLIVAGNEILESQALQSGARRVIVVPTGIEMPEQYSNAEEKKIDSLTIGWIGTKVNLPFLESWEPIFNRLSECGFRFNLRIMSSVEPTFLKFHTYEFIEWSESAQDDFLREIDIGLMPLFDNEYTAGKCAYKALQYLSYAKPVVASDVGVNAVWLSGGAFVSNDEGEIFDAIRKLLLDGELRRQMGMAGRLLVEDRFKIEVIASQVRHAIFEAK